MNDFLLSDFLRRHRHRQNCGIDRDLDVGLLSMAHTYLK